MQINSDFEFQIKIVIIGDSGVGKTNFIFQFTEGRFSPLHVTTVGFDYKSKIIKLPTSKKKVKLQIWDTAGQERYMALNKNIFPKVQGIIVMYDLTNRNSFDNLNRWFTLVSQNASNKPRILVANKSDLAEDNRIVTEDEGNKLAKEHHMPFFEGSGCSGENVDKIFGHLAEMVYTNLINNEKESVRSLNSTKQLETTEEEKKRCCK
jgi:small GTP-binding protein